MNEWQIFVVKHSLFNKNKKTSKVWSHTNFAPYRAHALELYIFVGVGLLAIDTGRYTHIYIYKDNDIEVWIKIESCERLILSSNTPLDTCCTTQWCSTTVVRYTHNLYCGTLYTHKIDDLKMRIEELQSTMKQQQ